MISFDQDSVTMSMMGQFVFSVLTESSEFYRGEGVCCVCPGFETLAPLYRGLKRLLAQLKDGEDFIVKRLLLG